MQHFDEEANLVRINSLLKCHFVIQAGVLFLWKRSSIRKGTQAGNETRDLNLQSNSSFIGKLWLLSRPVYKFIVITTLEA